MTATSSQRIHIVGVGGPGTSAIAIILAEMGHRVSGSDVRESQVLDRLRAAGVAVNVPHDPIVVNGCDIVTYSAAVRQTNVELVAAVERGVRVLTRAAMLGWIATQATTIAVAGTHGKTTTTTLLTMMMREAGRDPGYLIGADVPQLPASAHWGDENFVVEADESDSSHRAIKPYATILTNVDVDHLDEHGSYDGIVASFDEYLAEIRGPKVLCIDDPTTARLAHEHSAITYGLGAAMYRATNVQFVAGGARFMVEHPDGRLEVSLPLRGIHNVRNFLAAFAMARVLGVSAESATRAVADFAGVHRRFEVRAHDGGATFIDDYAHLPAEIAAVLAAVRADSAGFARVIAVFQPNRFNRMAVMSDAYRDAFIDADVVVITDIYASGTDRIEGVTGQLVVDAIRNAHPHARVEWRKERADLVEFVARECRDGDLCISMGCGDIETFPDEVVARRRIVTWRPDDTDDYARRTRAIDRLGILLGPRVRRDVDLATYTTYKVGGPASLFVTAHSIDDLHAVSNALREHKVPVLVIGRGSNLLVADEGFDGLVLQLGDFAEEIVWPKRPAPSRVTAGGAVPLPVLARQCASHSLTGFEWGVGVPGSVGGAVRMNAGGHGSDIASSIESAKIFHLGKGIIANVAARDLGLRFRGSDLQSYHVVLSVTFALSWGDQAASEAEMSDIVRWRREHQPGGQNAGSVFVNPEPGGGSAGAIIDRIGLRGLRIGTAEVSSKHANFIQCDEGGSAADVADLMAEVRERVNGELGIDLHSEVRLVGFDDETAADAGAQTAGNVETTLGTTRSLTALDKVFGPLVTDDTLGGATIAPPLPGDAVAELRELFADTGAIARPADATPSDEATADATPSSETPSDSPTPSGDTPVADVVDISSVTSRGATVGDSTPSPIVIDDSDHLLPHERPEGSATLTLDPTSPFSDASTAVPGAGGLADVISDRRLGRRAWWKRIARVRISPLIGFAALIGTVSLVLVVLASPIFAVRDIEVSGATYTDALLLDKVRDSLRGASVFTADLDGAQRRLEGDPWVERARLSWYLPDRVVIEIDERTPVAWFVGVDNRARVLDFTGRVLDVLDGQPTQFVKIEGVGPNLPAGTVTTPVYQAAAQVAIALPPDTLKRLKHVTVNGPESLGFVLKTGTVVNLGAPVDIRNKLTIVQTVLTRQDPEFIVGIDVSGGQLIINNG